jgi:hypothetical protein
MIQLVRSRWQAKKHILKLTVEEVADQDVGKEVQSGNAVMHLRTCCVLGVQSIEDRTNGKVVGPYYRHGCDKNTLADTTNQEANQLG